MPAAIFDMKAWLADLKRTGELSDDEAKALDILTSKPKAVEFVSGGYLRQDDYSRQMNALKEQERTLQAAADAKVQKELDEIKRYRGESDSNYQRAVDERVAAEQRLIAIRAQIESLGRDYALPNDVIDPILKGTPATKTAEQLAEEERRRAAAARTNDPDPRYMSVDQFKKEAGAYSRLPIEYMQIAGEYTALFKSDAYVRPNANTPSPIERVLERSIRDNIPLRAAFEREFSVQAKRDELREADIQARIKTAADERERTVRSQIAAENPGVHSGARPAGLPHSPALESAGVPKRDPSNANAPILPRAGNPSAHEDRVSRAVTAFQANLSKALEGSNAA